MPTRRQAKPSHRPARNAPAGRSTTRSQAGLAVELTVRADADFAGPADRGQITLTGLVARPRRQNHDDPFPGVAAQLTVARQITRGTRPERLSRLLAALAHPQRLAILTKLLAGEATHKLLSNATGLKAGPLYHHLRELRAAGLLGPKVRDVYVLTPKGRRAILAAMALERLCAK